MLAEFELKPNLRYHPQDVLMGSLRLMRQANDRAAKRRLMRNGLLVPINQQVAGSIVRRNQNSETTSRRAQSLYNQAALSYNSDPAVVHTTISPTSGSSYMLNISSSDAQTRGTTLPMSILK